MTTYKVRHRVLMPVTVEYEFEGSALPEAAWKELYESLGHEPTAAELSAFLQGHGAVVTEVNVQDAQKDLYYMLLDPETDKILIDVM